MQVDLACPRPTPVGVEALVSVLRAGICSTDLEILKGYVPGFNHVLGHEFVGRVEECKSRPELVGKRVVAEINCRVTPYSHHDPIMVRNHAEGRVVLGIIAKDGCMADYVTLPAENLFVVPDDVSDRHAAFAEPLAAACRILEQEAISPGAKVAVIGDGKLGLLVAQLLSIRGWADTLTFFGRHQRKLDLVSGGRKEVVGEGTAHSHAAAFDVCVEACGAPGGMQLALAMTRPMGTVVLKSTCSISGHDRAPQWSEIANDVVVQEKTIVGSRCGPFAPALAALQHPAMQKLLDGMIDAEVPIQDGAAAFAKAQTKGTLKVQLVMDR